MTATDQAIDDRGVATLTLARPELHNAFDPDLIAELTQRFEDLTDDPSVRVVVLAGAGRSFSAGADLGWMKRMAAAGEAENVEDARRLAGLMRAIDTCPKPVVARVHGAAFGGGVGLVACCDIAVASEAASFALTEVRLGIIPAAIGPYVVTAIGPRAARRLFLTAERFDAAEARRLGLVHEIAAPDALDAAVAHVVASLLEGGPAAQAAAKRLVADIAHRPVDAALIDLTARRIAERRVSAEGQEGLGAFLEKRKPAWAVPGAAAKP